MLPVVSDIFLEARNRKGVFVGDRRVMLTEPLNHISLFLHTKRKFHIAKILRAKWELLLRMSEEEMSQVCPFKRHTFHFFTLL